MSRLRGGVIIAELVVNKDTGKTVLKLKEGTVVSIKLINDEYIFKYNKEKELIEIEFGAIDITIIEPTPKWGTK